MHVTKHPTTPTAPQKKKSAYVINFWTLCWSFIIIAIVNVIVIFLQDVFSLYCLYPKMVLFMLVAGLFALHLSPTDYLRQYHQKFKGLGAMRISMCLDFQNL